MSFDWSQYLTLAQELAGRPSASASPEARLRTAISRAYYAAFCKARNLLRDKDRVSIPKKDSHQFVIDQFKNHSDRSRMKVGEDLHSLRRDRNRADYSDTFQPNQQLISSDLMLAQQALDTLNNL